MSKTKTPPLGLHYMAFDLHVHTPASEDFPDKSATPKNIVEAAIKADLDGVCITDHNTADWVDRVSEAAKGKSVNVFPGVEISVTGGKEGPIHIIGIFAPGTTSEEISDLLTTVGLTKAKRGKTDELAEGDPNTIINAISKHGGIPVLAHADSNHGVLHDMKGQPRIKVIQNEQLLAAEARNEKYKKVLDGNDPDYKRFLPTYEASDAHSLADIGSHRTLFKAAAPTLEALKQCFYDPQVRLHTEQEFQPSGASDYPKILRIS